MPFAKGTLDTHPVRRFVPAPIWLDEAVVACAHCQAFGSLARVDERDETAVGRFDKRLVHRLGHFGFCVVCGRDVDDRTPVSRGAIVLLTNGFELQPCQRIQVLLGR